MLSKGKNSVIIKNIKENMTLNGQRVSETTIPHVGRIKMGGGQAKCREKSFLVTGNISYLIRYISNLVISIYVSIHIYMNILFQDPDPDHRGAKESTE